MKGFKTSGFVLGIFLNDFQSYPWSIPERLWLLFHPPSESALQEMEISALCRNYLWLSSAQLRRCAGLYEVPAQSSFFLNVLDRVYQPLITNGCFAPFPVIIYLAAGFALRQVDLPDQFKTEFGSSRASDQNNRGAPPTEIKNFVNGLNLWLSEILSFDLLKNLSFEERQQAEHNRINWLALNQFVRRALSENEIGPQFKKIAPDIHKSEYFRQELAEAGDSVEQRLMKGFTPALRQGLSGEYKDSMETYLESMSEKVSRWLPRISAYANPQEQEQRKAQEQQERAVRYYLGRAGVNRARPDASFDEDNLPENVPYKQEALLDFHALSGYQAFGKFLPDYRTMHLLELLRRQLLDPTATLHSRQSAVEGIARRGNFSQLLKWQLALGEVPDGERDWRYFYDRYFNNQMLYLRRVSQHSENLSLTMVMVIDQSIQSNRQLPNNQRQHSITREVCAQILQDTYQVLWQVPKLFADVMIFAHDGQSLTWQTSLVLADGSGTKPIAEDIFLKEPPPWLIDDPDIADPATFFQFQLPALTSGRRFDPSNFTANTRIAEKIVDSVRLYRHARIGWLKAHDQVQSAGILPDSDLLVSVAFPVATAATISNSRISENTRELFEITSALGTVQHKWEFDCLEKIEMKLEGSSSEKLLCNLDEFRRQIPVSEKSGNFSIRQYFVQQVLEQLFSLCSEMEFA